MMNINQVERKMETERDASNIKKVPLEIERKQTNFGFIVLMGIYLTLWVGIAIFAGCSGKFVPTFVVEIRWIAMKFSAFTALMSLSYIIMLKKFARALVFITIFIFCILLEVVIIMFASNLLLVIILVILLVLTLITIIVLKEKIQIAVEVLRVVSNIFMSFPSLVFFTILPCILYGIVMLFYLSTLDLLIYNYSFKVDLLHLFHVINMFGCLWFILFITGWSQTVLSGSFCTWYWSLNKSYISRCTTITNFFRITVRYHLGTIACGSLLIILCKLISLLLYTLGILCIRCGCYEPLFRKLEKFMMCINRYAYIVTSSHGTGFLKSAKTAFNIVKNCSIISIDRVVEAILILGQLLIICISALATYCYCQWNSGECNHDKMLETLLMVILSGVIITKSIFMIPKIATNSIFLCILEENEEIDKTVEKPCYVNDDVKAPFLLTFE